MRGRGQKKKSATHWYVAEGVKTTLCDCRAVAREAPGDSIVIFRQRVILPIAMHKVAFMNYFSRTIGLALVAALLLAGGCAAAGGKLTAQSLGGQNRWVGQFSQGYVQQLGEGDYQVILLDMTPPSLSQTQGKMIQPVRQRFVRQMVRIHVLWKPKIGTRADFPAATNAGIDWLIISDDPADTQAICYKGAGFVTLTPRGDKADLTVHQATLTPTVAPGSLHDPLGQCQVSGSARLLVDERRVASAMEELRQYTRPCQLGAPAPQTQRAAIESVVPTPRPPRP